MGLRFDPDCRDLADLVLELSRRRRHFSKDTDDDVERMEGRPVAHAFTPIQGLGTIDSGGPGVSGHIYIIGITKRCVPDIQIMTIASARVFIYS